MRNTFIYLTISILLSLSAWAQDGFRSRYLFPGSQVNHSYGIFETEPSHYLAAGFCTDSSEAHKGFLLLQGLDDAGSVNWQKEYKWKNTSLAHNLLTRRKFYQARPYHYFVSAVNRKFGPGGLLVKLTNSGDTLWSKFFSSLSGIVIPEGMGIGNDSAIFVVGHLLLFNNSGTPGLVIKFDKNGNELWSKIINKPSPNTVRFRSIAQHKLSGKIVAVGYSGRYGAIEKEAEDCVYIFDSIGNVAGSHKLMLPQMGGTLVDLIETADGALVTVGVVSTNTLSGSANLRYSFISKFSIITNSIQVHWQNETFDRLSPVNDFASVFELSNGDLLVGGVIDTMFGFNYSYNLLARTVVFDQNGNLKKYRTYNYDMSGDPTPYFSLQMNNLAPTSDGGMVAALETRNWTGPNNLFFVKYTADGCDSTEIYCKTVGLQDRGFSTSGWELAPNPVRDKLTLRFSDQQQALYTVSIFDLTGMEMLRQDFRQGEEESQIALDTLPCGMYLIRLVSESGRSEVKRFVKMD